MFNVESVGPSAIDILIVEDSPTQAALIRRTLEEQGFVCDVARSGAEALSILFSRHPRLVISDIGMPGMDGFELCRYIKRAEHFRNTPVILLTSLTDPEDVLLGLEAGADNYVTKPYDEGYLISRVKHLLKRVERESLRETSEGLELSYEGKQYLVTMDRHQILTVLISMFENMAHQNRSLTRTQLDLERVNEDLRRVNAQLEEALAFRSESVANLTGELQVRLGMLMSAAQAVAQGSDHFVSAYPDFPKRVLNEVELLTKLLTGVFETSDVDGWHLHLKPAAFSVGQAVNDVLTLINPVATSKRLLIEVRSEPVEIQVHMDPVRFRQILYNLMSNAVKFTPEGGEISVRIRMIGQNLEVSISDTGPGIPPENQRILFEPQTWRSASKQPRGSMGLALSSRLVNIMGGEIHVRSASDHGSTFTFRLPANLREEAARRGQ